LNNVTASSEESVGVLMTVRNSVGVLAVPCFELMR
jgi:hypothetical protein